MTQTKTGALSGNQKRKMKSAARLYAVQALFQMEAAAQSATSVVAEFLDHRFGAVYEGDEMLEGDVDLFRDLVETAVTYQAQIDQMTDRALVAKWPIARIDPTLRALFRAGGAEMGHTQTPPKVVIAEFVAAKSVVLLMQFWIIWRAKHSPTHFEHLTVLLFVFLYTLL